MSRAGSWRRIALGVFPIVGLAAITPILANVLRIVRAYPSDPDGNTVAYLILLALAVSAVVYDWPIAHAARDRPGDLRRSRLELLLGALPTELPRAWAGLLFVGAALTWTLLNYRVDSVYTTPDTDSYASVGEAGLRSQAFWAGERPPTVPLVLRIFGLSTGVLNDPSSFPHHARVFTQFQSILSAAAFIVLGLAVASHVRHWWLKACALAIVAAFGMTMDVSQWNRMLTSESLSTSFLSLWIALWLVALDAWRKWDRLSIVLRVALGLGLGFLGVLYSFARDANAFLLLALSIALALGLASRRVRAHPAVRAYLSLTVFLAGVFLLQYGLMGRAGRWVVPLANVLHVRILPSEEGRSFLAAAGLRVEVLPVGILSSDCGDDCDEFHLQLMVGKGGRVLLDWIRLSGKASYLRYLASHLSRAFVEPVANAEELLSGDSTEYRNRVYPDPQSALHLRNIFYPRSTGVVLFWAAALLLGMIAMLFTEPPRIAALIPLILLLTAYPLMLVVWHGDAAEVERHATQIGFQVRLALWMGTVIGLDCLWTRDFARRKVMESSDTALPRP